MLLEQQKEMVKSVNRESVTDMKEMIKKWLHLAYEKDDVIECRIPKAGDPKGKFFPTYSGYYEYDNFNKLILDLSGYNSLLYAEGIYTTLNPVNADLLARSANRLKQSRDATSDAQIVCRRWLPIDCDPVRASGISSTNKELELSLNRAKEIKDFLVAECNFPANCFIYAQSGNGAHLLVKIETLENNGDSTSLIANDLKAISNKFSDTLVKIDTVVYNASRIWKSYGTMARKGDSLPDRPHRYAKILESPEKKDLVFCPKELLEKLASLTPVNKTYSLPTKTSNHKHNNVVNISNKNNLSNQAILDRAKKYLDKIPGAISGQNGHGTTYYAANVLINGFNLSFDDAFTLLSEWNKKCQPPWDDGEFIRKLNDAENNESSKSKGYLINTNEDKNIENCVDLPTTAATTDDDKTPIANIDFRSVINSVEPHIEANETGDAQFFTELFQNKLVFDHSEQSWFLYKKHHWIKDINNKAILFSLEKLTKAYKNKIIELNKCISKINNKEDKQHIKQLITKIEKRIYNLNTKHRANSVLKIAESKLVLPEKVEWNGDAFLLPVKNGVLDLRTGKLRKGKPGDFFNAFSPVKWKSINEPCPNFEKFLEGIFDNKPNKVEIIKALQRLFGYSITGLSTEHVFPNFIGEGGRNGKDTLFETLAYVLGDFASTADRDCLIESRRDAGSATPYLRELKGKRLVWVSEIKKGNRLNVAQVKYITGGGRIKARGLHENLTEFEPTHLMCLLANDKPHVNAEDNAIWDRIMLISFDLSFVENPVEANQRKRNPQLKEMLKKEASGILAWLVRGCLDWQKHGLNIPRSMRQEKNEYRDTEDTIGLFLNDYCIIDDNESVLASELYDAYVEWSNKNNLRAITGTDFGLRIKKRIGEDKKVRAKKGYAYKGIKLKI